MSGPISKIDTFKESIDEYIPQLVRLGYGDKLIVNLDHNRYMTEHFLAKIICSKCKHEHIVDRDEMVAVMKTKPLKAQDAMVPVLNLDTGRTEWKPYGSR